MRQGYTHIVIVLDRSGSMRATQQDTIGGVNQFLGDQKAAPGEATLTLVLFDHEYEVVHDQMPIKAVPALTVKTYVQRGITALLDALGRTIDNTGKHLQELDEAERPEKVIFVIITDGMENASHTHTIQAVNKKIEHQRQAYKWEFVFLGANQDAITSASQLGIPAQSSMTYAANAAGTASAYNAASINTVSLRSATMDCFAFSDEDRAKQTAAGVDPAQNKVASA